MGRRLKLGDKLDVALPDLHGQQIKLTDYLGKHVLLFMWASW